MSALKAFLDMVRAAGMIFSATASRIERRPATPRHPVETVAITFRVEQAIRGATPGEELTISQWMGLWSGGGSGIAPGNEYFFSYIRAAGWG